MDCNEGIQPIYIEHCSRPLKGTVFTILMEFSSKSLMIDIVSVQRSGSALGKAKFI